MSKYDNPLKNAPHTALDLADDNWTHPYPRILGCYPAGVSGDKYWCPVNRVDNVYGDRHLICTCPPMESYQRISCAGEIIFYQSSMKFGHRCQDGVPIGRRRSFSIGVDY